MKQLSRKNMILVGLTLFSMFFGAGNLIFPPFLGAQAGSSVWIAMAGFAFSAIGLPILGVAAVAKSGGLMNLAGRVHKYFAFIFTLLIYLSIGPGLAIPRTASTSFEMAVIPFVGDNISLTGPRVIYSIVFFAIAMALAMNPDKLTDRLGKILTPCLLTLILVLFIASLIKSIGSYNTPVQTYQNLPFVVGFLDGYQTMDTIAALNFGIIISINIIAKGIKEEKTVVKETMKAGVIAGVVLILVYGALAHIGALTSSSGTTAQNGAEVLTYAANVLFGPIGMILLAIIFFIACLNTCIGLLSCCSEYFNSLVPKISYKKWVIIFAVISLAIANLGLNKILEISVPILNAIYPLAIVLIFLAFLDNFIGKFHYIYPIGMLATGFTSVIDALQKAGIRIPALTGLVEKFPFYQIGLSWIIPAIVGIVIGLIVSVTVSSSAP